MYSRGDRPRRRRRRARGRDRPARSTPDRAERRLEAIPWVEDAAGHHATSRTAPRSRSASGVRPSRTRARTRQFRVLDDHGRVLDVLGAQPVDVPGGHRRRRARPRCRPVRPAGLRAAASLVPALDGAAAGPATESVTVDRRRQRSAPAAHRRGARSASGRRGTWWTSSCASKPPRPSSTRRAAPTELSTCRRTTVIHRRDAPFMPPRRARMEPVGEPAPVRMQSSQPTDRPAAPDSRRDARRAMNARPHSNEPTTGRSR